jgi:acyl carrier protein
VDCTPAQIAEIVGRFLSRTRGIGSDAVQPSTALLREGLLDSFSLVELMLDLEQALGVTLQEGALLPEDFDTPQVLCERIQQL